MYPQDDIGFCTQCGVDVSVTVPVDDNRPRHVCNGCGHIQYQNPKVVCGCIPVWQDRILMCRRAIEPRRGLWTLPAGFMENGESVQQGAVRETWEEALAEVLSPTLYGIYNLPHINQVYVMFRAEMTGESNFGIGEESLESRLFDEADIPWDDLAFRVVRHTLERYLRERRTGHYSVTVEDIL